MVSTSAARGETSTVARHIARVAARLFATRGYDATSVRTIVEAAGVTKPTLYYYFGSKEGLAQALLTVPMRGLGATLKAIVDTPGDPVDALVRVFEAKFDFCREDPDRARFVFSLLFGPQNSGLAGELAQVKEELPCVLDKMVRHLAEVGVIDPERVEACATACHGLTVITAIDYLYEGREIEPGQARRLVEDLLRGFRAAPPS
ncbi:MAG: TetR/AcrR family transcriptional regulator [Isosphaeraceae bacterium]|nr:TetR/AcrR family transcriptional regulator [Isosphaeraceae bacterium]